LNNYQTSIEINCLPEMLFEAISRNLGDWWGKQDRLIEKQGMVFKVSWGEPWYQFEVVKFLKHQEMIWKCIDANQKIEGLRGVEKEWVGTEIHWIVKGLNNNRSLLEFEHKGLIPDFICFDFCSKAWSHFLNDSLVKYLTQDGRTIL
jgi:hypothetical protein